MERKKIVRKTVRHFSQVLLSCLLEELELIVENETNKKKRIWMRNWIGRKITHGGSSLLLKELREEDPAEYRCFMRMSPDVFDALHKLVASDIQREDTLMRDAIPSVTKLEVTLSFLATGNSFRSLQHFFRVSKPAISKFIPEVCEIIWKKLKDKLKVRNFYLLMYYI